MTWTATNAKDCMIRDALIKTKAVGTFPLNASGLRSYEHI